MQLAAHAVVASRSCVDAISAEEGAELLSATSAPEFAAQLHALLSAPERATAVGSAGRARVLAHYSWSAHLSGIDHYLAPQAAPLSTL